MEKRLFIAMILSLLFLSIYYRIVSTQYPNVPQQLARDSQPEDVFEPGSESRLPEPAAPREIRSRDSGPKEEFIMKHDLQPIEEKELVRLENEALVLFFNPRGAFIEKALIKEHNTFLPQQKIALIAEWQSENFTHEYINDGIIFAYNDLGSGLTVKKRFQFIADHGVDCSVELASTDPGKTRESYSFNIGTVLQSELKKPDMDQRYFEFSVALQEGNTVLRKAFSSFNVKEVKGRNISWIGIRNRYFCSILKPHFRLTDVDSLTDSNAISYVIAPGNDKQQSVKIQHRYTLYLGPQKQEYIEQVDKEMSSIVHFGFLDTLSQLLLSGLNGLFKITKNWGAAIILFGIIIFVLISPLSIKSFSSIKKMQQLQPLMEELRHKHKDNPQKMNKEIMALYKEKQINPLGGCLPMLLQMPIFIALYQALIRFIDLKGAHFLWIKDLSEPDRLFTIGGNLPIIGRDINLLPLLMMLTMFIQQKISTVRSKTESGQQQAMMGWIMVVVFGLLFYHMPSGLVLYWVTNSILMLIFQSKLYLGKET